MASSIGPELPEEPQHKPVEKPTSKFAGMRKVSQTPDLPSKQKAEDVAQSVSQDAELGYIQKLWKVVYKIGGDLKNLFFKIVNFEFQPETSSRKKHLQSLGMGQLESKIIANWITQNDAKLEAIQSNDLPLTHQITTPKGLKYYKADDGSVHIQFKNKVVGKGAFKKVKAIYDISLLNFSLLKLVRFSAVKKAARKRFIEDMDQELSVRQQLRKKGALPEGIVDIREITYMAKNGELKTRYIAEECEGTVFDFIYSDKEGDVFNRELDKGKIYQIYLDALYGLKALHEKELIHRDLKPENILHKKGRGKLSDFGYVMKFSPNRKTDEKCVGTSGYKAPEIFTRSPKAVIGSDMFSFGLMLLEIYDNEAWYLMSEYQYNGQVDLCNSCIQNYRESIERNYSEDQLVQEQQKLIFDLLNPNPEDRPDIDETIRRLKSIIAQLEHPA